MTKKWYGQMIQPEVALLMMFQTSERDPFIQQHKKGFIINAMFLVIIIFAFFPFPIDPCVSLSSIAAAPLMVTALIACSGVNPIFIHARESTKGMFPEGVEPGL